MAANQQDSTRPSCVHNEAPPLHAQHKEEVINIQLPYDPHAPIEPKLQSGSFHPISLHGSIEHFASDSKNIKVTLNFLAKYIRNKQVNCYGNHLSQGQMITQGVNLLVEVSSGKFTRELDKEFLLNQCPIYTNVSWSVLPLSKPALQSMLYPHVHLTSYSRPLCVFQVP